MLAAKIGFLPRAPSSPKTRYTEAYSRTSSTRYLEIIFRAKQTGEITETMPVVMKKGRLSVLFL